MYDLHICGEGGEYETFTVDCPLFKRRIVVEETETIIHSDDAFAQVAYLKFKKCTTVEKTKEEMDMSNVVIQDWKNWELYEDVVSAVNNVKDKSITKPKSIECSGDRSVSMSAEQQEILATNHAPFFAISGTTAYDKDGSKKYDSIEDETRACMKAVQGTYSAAWSYLQI